MVLGCRSLLHTVPDQRREIVALIWLRDVRRVEILVRQRVYDQNRAGAWVLLLGCVGLGLG
jgi:hypothetical protein